MSRYDNVTKGGKHKINARPKVRGIADCISDTPHRGLRVVVSDPYLTLRGGGHQDTGIFSYMALGQDRFEPEMSDTGLHYDDTGFRVMLWTP